MSYHIYRYTMVVIGCLITASAINLFYIPNMLLSGGITGLGFLIYYITGLPIGMMNILPGVEVYGQGILFRFACQHDLPFACH